MVNYGDYLTMIMGLEALRWFNYGFNYDDSWLLHIIAMIISDYC